MPAGEASMSHRPLTSQLHPDSHAGRASNSRAAGPAQQSGYALVHAGRQVRIGPVAFWIVVGTLSIMAVWTMTTATYFAFRDDVLTRLIARQAEMQYAYEDRIADLRGQIDRISSRQLLDQEQYDQRLEQILQRQAALESRANTLGGKSDGIVTGSTKPGGKKESTRPAPTKPSPVKDKSSSLPSDIPFPRHANMAITLAHLQASLDRVEARQAETLTSVEDNYDTRARHIRGVLADLGINPARMGGGSSPTGGPFVAARLPANAGNFERQVYRISVARAQFDRLVRAVAVIPVRRPVVGDIELSSGFGMRIDPFVRAPAMHTGLDFRGDPGDPVRATADGTVSMADWNGGYGRMIEIDHGHGLATRYAHLSAIDVRLGQRVRAGQFIGKIGTTGRSTGPHLHYETRINGSAVDPHRFLRAGLRLGSIH
jgi:murein DD-endopeptidase MepM/ murein hydrolase activator NlpD